MYSLMTFPFLKGSPLLVVPQGNHPSDLVASVQMLSASPGQSRQGNRHKQLAWGRAAPALPEGVVAQTLEGVSPSAVQELEHTPLVEDQLVLRFSRANRAVINKLMYLGIVD